MLSILVMKIHHNLPSIAVLPFLLVIARMASCYHSRGPLVNGRFPVQEVSSSRSGTSISRVLRQDGPDFPNVLAFPATLSRPVTRLGRPVSELPLKKRIFKRLRNSFELKKENASEKGEVMLNKTAVTEANVNAIPFSGSSEMKDSKKHKSCQFMSNRECSIPCPNIGGPKPKEKENAKVLPAKALLVKRNEVEKQRRGQLKKSSKASRGGKVICCPEHLKVRLATELGKSEPVYHLIATCHALIEEGNSKKMESSKGNLKTSGDEKEHLCPGLRSVAKL